MPVLTDQVDEDHAIPDDEWAELMRKAKEGKTLAGSKVSVAWSANRVLKEAQRAAISDLRQQIARLERSIARNA